MASYIKCSLHITLGNKVLTRLDCFSIIFYSTFFSLSCLMKLIYTHSVNVNCYLFAPCYVTKFYYYARGMKHNVFISL